MTVILAPAGVLGSVRSILQDWAAAGLVDDFVWVEPSGVKPPDAKVLYTDEGRQHGSTLRNAVADARPEQVTLCVLVPALDGIDAVRGQDEQIIAQILDSATGGITDRIRCVVTRPDVSTPHGEVAREGWHNVILAPEDRAGAQGPSVLLSDDGDLRQLGMHAALGVAGLLGLWRPAGRPAVGGPPGPGRNARLAVSYYRRLEAGDTEAALRRSVLSMESGLPRPRRHGTSAVYVPEPERAVMVMAQSWWQKHRPSLLGPRETIEQQPLKPIGVRAALREFLSFLAAALRNAPGQWLARKKSLMSAGMARKVSAAVYGTGSAYTVVVNGLTGDGMPASWLKLAAAAGTVESALDAANIAPGQDAHGDLAPLWEDFAAAGLTLGDGQARVETFAPVQVGADLGVIRDTTAIAPPDTMSFTELSGQLSAVLDIREIRPCDVLGAYNVQEQLAFHSQTPSLQLEVASVEQKLRQWRTVNQNSFAVRVAEYVGKALLDTKNEVQSLLAMLTDAAGDDSGQDEARQRALGRRLRWLLLALVLVLIGVGVMVGVGLLGVLAGVTVGVIVLIGGLLAMARVFFVQQRAVFQLLHRTEQMHRAAEVATRNLRAALRDIQRMTVAYGQLQIWARVLAAFLAEPFGRREERVATNVRLAGPFPRGMRIGIIEPDATASAEVVADIRREVFGVGWLGRPWEALIAEAARRVGPEAPDTLDAPRALYGKPSAMTAGTGDSFLSVWGEIVVRDGASTESSEQLWRGVLDSMQGPRADLAGALMTRIRSVGTSDDATVAVGEFLAGIEDTNVALPYLNDALLSYTARTHGASQVETQVRAHVPNGLGRTSTLTQLTSPIPHYEFAFQTVESAGSGDGSGQPQERDDEFKPPPMPGVSLEAPKADPAPPTVPQAQEPQAAPPQLPDANQTPGGVRPGWALGGDS